MGTVALVRRLLFFGGKDATGERRTGPLFVLERLSAWGPDSAPPGPGFSCGLPDISDIFEAEGFNQQVKGTAPPATQAENVQKPVPASVTIQSAALGDEGGHGRRDHFVFKLP